MFVASEDATSGSETTKKLKAMFKGTKAMYSCLPPLHAVHSLAGHILNAST